VAEADKVWIGLEYFCNDTDPIWKLTDEAMAQFAISEVAKIGILRAEDVEDSHVVRVPKTYPAYFGSYDRFDVIRDYLNEFENLFLIGRNGMHKYNNQDHSMLTAMTAVENIVNGVKTKDNIWAINTEMEYHEEKAAK
jgi:protoporphyrinogen oxidase